MLGQGVRILCIGMLTRQSECAKGPAVNGRAVNGFNPRIDRIHEGELTAPVWTIMILSS
jgi:hypothetical protein